MGNGPMGVQVSYNGSPVPMGGVGKVVRYPMGRWKSSRKTQLVGYGNVCTQTPQKVGWRHIGRLPPLPNVVRRALRHMVKAIVAAQGMRRAALRRGYRRRHPCHVVATTRHIHHHRQRLMRRPGTPTIAAWRQLVAGGYVRPPHRPAITFCLYHAAQGGSGAGGRPPVRVNR